MQSKGTLGSIIAGIIAIFLVLHTREQQAGS